MKFVLNLVIQLAVVSTSQFAFALSGPSTPTGGGHGHAQCGYYDTGWEEHGYHSTCGECNQKHHGSCEERCYSYTYNCTASGYTSTNTKLTAIGYGRVEYQARNEALDGCYRQGLTNCSIDTCNEDSSLISSKRCQ